MSTTSPAPLIQTFEQGEIVPVLSHWTHRFFGPEWSMKDLCKVADRLGLQLDLAPPDEQAVTNNFPRVCNMCVLPDMGDKPGSDEHYDPFDIGFNDRNHWQTVRDSLTHSIIYAAACGTPFVIVFTGMANDDLSKQQQTDNLVAGFKTVVGHAEQNGVVLVLEMLNDRVTTPMMGHPGYFGNSTATTAAVVRQVNSPNLGLVADVYHMEIMGEDSAVMIREHRDLIRYVHLAGAYAVSEDPEDIQRAELDGEGQQIDFYTVMATLKEIGFGGPVAFEYVPTTTDSKAAEENLRKAMQLCGL